MPDDIMFFYRFDSELRAAGSSKWFHIVPWQRRKAMGVEKDTAGTQTELDCQ